MINPKKLAEWFVGGAKFYIDPRNVAFANEAAETILMMEKELKAAHGYMLNAALDLETGASKYTALRTINGGIERIKSVLKELDQ
jgi:hypothetical protein